MKKLEKVLLGYCPVDSGQILLADPCYIDSEWEKTVKELNDEANDGKFSYGGCCRATSKKELGGQTELGVAVSSGYGDGSYPVYAYISDEGEWGKRVKKVEIEFFK